MAHSEPIVFLNGQFIPRSSATMDIEDRGTMFGDGVYEVIRYYASKPLAMDGHLARLKQSLRSIRIEPTKDMLRLDAITDELIERNRMPEARVYWQVTRGPATPRKYPIPAQPSPTLLALTYPDAPLDVNAPVPKITAALLPDERWHRCAIKSLMLLPSVLALHKAMDLGAEAAILHRDGVVTESTSANVFVVRDGELWTHPADQWILGGITRAILLSLARKLNLIVHESAVTREQLLSADEVMVCGTTSHVTAVTKVDDVTIGNGAVGPVTQRLHNAFIAHIREHCGV